MKKKELPERIFKSIFAGPYTYSNYKSMNTCKGLVGVSPAGHLMPASALYTRFISDTKLVERSGFLNFLQSVDEVVADQELLLNIC